MNSSIVPLYHINNRPLAATKYMHCSLLECGVWSKIKSKGAPFPIRGHRAVRVSLVYFKVCIVVR